MTRLTGSRCLCYSCGQHFNSVSTFDRHRIGAHPHRRCLTPEALTAKGWKVNEAGFWIERASPDRTRRSADPQEAA